MMAFHFALMFLFDKRDRRRLPTHMKVFAIVFDGKVIKRKRFPSYLRLNPFC